MPLNQNGFFVTKPVVVIIQLLNGKHRLIRENTAPRMCFYIGETNGFVAYCFRPIPNYIGICGATGWLDNSCELSRS